MRGGSFSAAALAFFASALLWHFAAPGWTLAQLRDAAATGDAARLARYVDLPALGASLAAGALPEAEALRFLGAALPAEAAAAAIDREGFSTFRVAAAREGALVFRRAGHAWRLVAFEPSAAGRG